MCCGRARSPAAGRVALLALLGKLLHSSPPSAVGAAEGARSAVQRVRAGEAIALPRIVRGARARPSSRAAAVGSRLPDCPPGGTQRAWRAQIVARLKSVFPLSFEQIGAWASEPQSTGGVCLVGRYK